MLSVAVNKYTNSSSKRISVRESLIYMLVHLSEMKTIRWSHQNFALPRHKETVSVHKVAITPPVWSKSRVAYGKPSSSESVHELMIHIAQPDRLLSAKFAVPNRLVFEFADGKSFSMPIKKLEMPVDEIDWPTAEASPDGMVMSVFDLRGDSIPIDASTIRCLVDKAYDAQKKAAVDALQLTREELRELAEISEPPPGWDE